MPKLTVHDLAADGEYLEDALGFRLAKGRVVWEGADYPKGGWNGEKTRIHRLIPQDDMTIKVAIDYIDPSTPIIIVRKEGK